MLETEIKKLTAAVEANTAARLLAPAAAPLAPSTAIEVPAEAPSTAVDIPIGAPGNAAPTIDIPVDIPAPPGADAAEVAAPIVDLKAITEGIVALCRARGRETAAKLMAEYGAAKVPDLKKVSDKYGEILGKINALITG